MTIPNTIVHGGKDFPLPQATNYEKTTDESEVVAGRILSYGTTVNQIKLYLANSKAIGVGLRQERPGYNTTTDKHDDTMAKDGKQINLAAYGPFLFKGCLDLTQSVANGDPLQAEAGTGKLQAMVAGGLVAYAMETSNAASADDDDFLAFFMGTASQRWIEETLTVTTNVATLTYVPVQIEYVEAKTASSVTGGINLITSGTVATKEAKLARSAKTLTFYATDAVTVCIVRYSF